MEQKEAVSRTDSRTGLEKEITDPVNHTGTATEEVIATEAASDAGSPIATAPAQDLAEHDDADAEEVEEEAEQEQALLPLASGIGHRLKRRPSTTVKPKKQDEDTAVELADQEDYPVASWRARTSENKGLGRGGLAAVVLLVIFVPTFIFFLYLLYSNTERIDAMRQNLANFNESGAVNAASGTVSPQDGLVQLLNRAGTQMYSLKVENLSPTGRVVLYTDNTSLAFTYGNLDPLDPDQIYAVWLSTKPAGSADAAYVRVANLPNNHTSGSAMLVNQNALPANFNLANYAEVIVTIEKADQKNARPAGPRAFSFDLTTRKS